MANQMILTKVRESSFLFDVVAPAGLKNGHIVALGAQNTNGTYASAAPAAITSLGMVIVAQVPLNYDDSKVENDYVIATGEVTRTYVIEEGQKMSFPTENFETTVTAAVGKYVIPQAADTELKVSSTLGGTEAKAWIIDKVYTKAGVPMITIRNIK